MVVVYCRDCGKELNRDALFCPFCGAKQLTAVMSPLQSNPVPMTNTQQTYEEKPPFTLKEGEKVEAYIERTGHERTGSVLLNTELTNTFLTNKRLIFIKYRGKNILASYPVEDILSVTPGRYSSGSKIEFTIRGADDTNDFTMLLVTRFRSKDFMRVNERDKLVTLINGLRAATGGQASPIQSTPAALKSTIQSSAVSTQPALQVASTTLAQSEEELTEDSKPSEVVNVSRVVVNGYPLPFEMTLDGNDVLSKFKNIIPDYLEKELKRKLVSNEMDEVTVFLRDKIAPIVRDYFSKISTPGLIDGEEILWQSGGQGFIHSRSSTWAITNYRALIYHAPHRKKPAAIKVAGLAISDVITMNQHRRSNSSHSGGFIYKKGIGLGAGSGSSTSTQYGDLVFIFDGKEVLRFHNVSDPNGVKRMVTALKRQIQV